MNSCIVKEERGEEVVEGYENERAGKRERVREKERKKDRGGRSWVTTGFGETFLVLLGFENKRETCLVDMCIAWPIRSDAHRIQHNTLVQFVNKALKPICVAWDSISDINRGIQPFASNLTYLWRKCLSWFASNIDRGPMHMNLAPICYNFLRRMQDTYDTYKSWFASNAMNVRRKWFATQFRRRKSTFFY